MIQNAIFGGLVLATTMGIASSVLSFTERLDASHLETHIHCDHLTTPRDESFARLALREWMSMKASNRRLRTLSSASSVTKTPTTANTHAMATNPTIAMMAIVHSNTATGVAPPSESSREPPVSVSHDAREARTEVAGTHRVLATFTLLQIYRSRVRVFM